MIGRGDEADSTAQTFDVERARSIIADVRMGRSTFARAAAALGIPSAQLPAGRKDRALMVYRTFVGAVVETASPLLFFGRAR